MKSIGISNTMLNLGSLESADESMFWYNANENHPYDENNKAPSRCPLELFLIPSESLCQLNRNDTILTML